jgi:urease accessory protein
LGLEDGRIVEVVAAPEPLAEIRAADGPALARVAWHLGNRHLPTEILPKVLRIRRDPIIEAMAKGLGSRVIGLEAPFNPEGGAYVKPENVAMGRHDHDHHHGHGHAHARGHEHDREHPRKDHHQGEQDHAASGARDRHRAHEHEHGHDRRRD